MYSKVEKYQAAKVCFAFNKAQDTCFVTGDLECFSVRNLAVNHGRGLEDKTIEVFERDGDEVTNNAAEASGSTADANTQPDSKLANDQANGQKLNQQFATVKPGGTPVKAKAETKPTAPKATKAPAAPKATKATAAPKAAKSDVPATEQKADEKGADA